MPMSLEGDATDLEELSDAEIIERIEAHIHKHKHKSLAPFSIAGMSRLLELAKKGLEKQDA